MKLELTSCSLVRYRSTALSALYVHVGEVEGFFQSSALIDSARPETYSLLKSSRLRSRSSLTMRWPV